MTKQQAPNFPRGFICSTRPVSVPATYIKGPILPNFYVHPWTSVHAAGDTGLFVIGIGHIVPTSLGPQQCSVDDLLGALQQSEASFLDLLSSYGGRHAVIFGSVGDIRIVNDATAMQSVFYSEKGGVAASHPLLVERALGGSIKKNALPFRYGYPGNRTPFARTRILTANTYFWLTVNVVRRFWPILPPAARTSDEAAALLLNASTAALQNMARGRAVHLSLTAGLDSRAIFAIALHSGIEFKTYTYGHDKATRIDQEVARELSNQNGVRHSIIGTRINDSELNNRLAESHYPPHHHGQWVRALKDHFSDIDSVVVLGNLLEIGRSNTANERKQMDSPPVTAKAMADLHLQRMGKARRSDVIDFGLENFKKISESAFQSYIDETGFGIQCGVLDPFDQFYWEHRMSTWQGYAMGERDYYATPFIPFNSRNIFEMMLGVPRTERHSDSTVIQMIQMVDPALLKIPINPKSWTTPKDA